MTGTERDASSAGSSSRRVVWKGGLIIGDGQQTKTLRGIVFQSPNPLPLHLSFFPPTPSTSTPGPPSSYHDPAPVPGLDESPAITSTPSQHATSSKVTLDTPFGGATAQYETGDAVIDACLRMKAVSALELETDVVPLADQGGSRNKAHELATGVRVIASATSSEAIRHVHTLLIPPKTKQPQALDSDGRTLRGVVLRCPVVDSAAGPIPPLLLYGIKGVSPRDNKPRLLLFITLYVQHPTKPRTGELAFVDNRASALADLRKRGKAPVVTNSRPPPPKRLSKQGPQSESEEERDPAPEPAKKRFKDRTGLGRGALLHHLPPPPPPHLPVAKRDIKGKGREREPSADSATSAPTAGKRRKVALDGQTETVVQRVAVKEVAVVEQSAKPSIEQINRNALRTQVSLALAARGLPPDHHEFKALGGWITRGAGFALRDVLTTEVLEVDEMSDAIGSHVESYLPNELKTPRRTTAESGCQTESATTREMETQTMEVEVEPVVEFEVDRSEPEQPAVEQKEAESPPIADDHPMEIVEVLSPEMELAATVATVPSTIEVEVVAQPAPTTPASTRLRTRSSAAKPAPSAAQKLASPFVLQSSAVASTSQTAAEGTADDTTPTKTRSGRTRKPAKPRAAVSSPLKVEQVVPLPAAVDVEAKVPAVAEPPQEPEVTDALLVEPVSVAPVEASPTKDGRTPAKKPSPRAKQPLRRTRSGRATSSVAAPSPAGIAAAALASPFVLTSATAEVAALVPAHSTPVKPASEPAAPPPSSLPSPSLSQTPTKTSFRRTRSNRSVLAESAPADASSPSTPVVAAEATVVTPAASTNKRTRRGTIKLEAGGLAEVAADEEPIERVTRSRTDSTESTITTAEVAPPAADEGMDADGAVVIEEQTIVSVIEEVVAPAINAPVLEAVVEESALDPELEDGEIEEGEEGEIIEPEGDAIGQAIESTPTSFLSPVRPIARSRETTKRHEAPTPPPLSPSPAPPSARQPLVESSTLINAEPTPVVEPSVPSPSLAKLLNLPVPVEASAPAPVSAQIPSPSPVPHILHHPSPIRTSPPALFAVLEEAAERMPSPRARAMSSLVGLLPPSDRPEPPRRVSLNVHSLLNPSDVVLGSGLSSSSQQGIMAAAKLEGRGGPLSQRRRPSMGTMDPPVRRVSGALTGLPSSSPASVSTGIGRSPLPSTSEDLLPSPGQKARQARSVTPTATGTIAIASLADYFSSPAQGQETDGPEPSDQQTPKAKAASSMLGLLGVGASTRMDGVEQVPMAALIVDDFFVAETEEEVEKESASLAPGERDPAMYYTDEEVEPMVKKGWY